MMRWVLFFLIPGFGLVAAAEESKFQADCEESFVEGKLANDRGVVIHSSAQAAAKKKCKGKVGESFCLEETKKDFISSCIERKTANEKKEMDKSLQFNEALREHEKKRDEEQQELERMREEEIDFIEDSDE